MASLHGRNAVLVGASQLGIDTAHRLLEQGARVLLVDVAASLEPVGHDGRLSAFAASGALRLHPVVDLAEESDAEEYALKAASELGGIDIAIFASVELQERQDLVHISEETYDKITTRAVRAAWLGVKHCARIMTREARSHEGVFLLVSSSAGLAGSPGFSAFSTTQWAIRGIGQSAAQEFAPLKIRTNTLHPALEDVVAGEAARFVRSEEVANVAAFLVSEKAGYINGLTVSVNGGTINWG